MCLGWIEVGSTLFDVNFSEQENNTKEISSRNWILIENIRWLKSATQATLYGGSQSKLQKSN